MPYMTVGKESGSGVLSALQFKWKAFLEIAGNALQHEAILPEAQQWAAKCGARV